MCHEPAMMNVVVGMHNETVSNVHVYMNHVNVALYVCMCKIRLQLIISKSMTRTTPWRPHIKDDWPRKMNQEIRHNSAGMKRRGGRSERSWLGIRYV